MSEHGGGLNGELLSDALDHLAAAGLTVEIVRTPATHGAHDAGTGSGDSVVVLTGPAGRVRYRVQVAAKVTSASAALVNPGTGDPLLVVAHHVPEAVAEQWRARGVQFVDAAGNTYLHGEGLLLDVRGRRPPSPRPAEPGRPLRAFQPRGLAVVFTLLCLPDSAGATYRRLAEFSGASLGTVQWVMTELTAAGHLQPTPQTRQLHRTRELLTRWVEAYALLLRPRLTLALLEAPDPTWWISADAALRRENAQWGDETAAHLLDQHLRPANAVIYATEVPSRLVVDYRLRKAHGPENVQIRRRFWNFPTPPDTASGAPLVPTPLVYADLLASGDPRLHEAATRLRENDDLLQRLDRT